MAAHGVGRDPVLEGGIRMEDERPIRVLIADDHQMVLEGLQVFLSTSDRVEVVGTAANGEEAVLLAEQLEPDVVLMDVKMPIVDGAEATARIRAANPGIQVVALTSFVEEKLVERILDAGAISYLLKDSKPEALLQAVIDAQAGRGTIDSAAMQTMMRKPPNLAGADLTPREREVLALLAAGLSNIEIAKSLTLSAGTVRLHVSSILAKLGAPNRTTAVVIALKHGLA
jgi:NarL family two-component system response regulator LiaR